ncbi:hypothetical protein MRX96_014761 [Rhipicephalus microplus]
MAPAMAYVILVFGVALLPAANAGDIGGLANILCRPLGIALFNCGTFSPGNIVCQEPLRISLPSVFNVGACILSVAPEGLQLDLVSSLVCPLVDILNSSVNEFTSLLPFRFLTRGITNAVGSLTNNLLGAVGNYVPPYGENDSWRRERQHECYKNHVLTSSYKVTRALQFNNIRVFIMTSIRRRTMGCHCVLQILPQIGSPVSVLYNVVGLLEAVVSRLGLSADIGGLTDILCNPLGIPLFSCGTFSPGNIACQEPLQISLPSVFNIGSCILSVAPDGLQLDLISSLVCPLVDVLNSSLNEFTSLLPFRSLTRGITSAVSSLTNNLLGAVGNCK